MQKVSKQRIKIKAGLAAYSAEPSLVSTGEHNLSEAITFRTIREYGFAVLRTDPRKSSFWPA
jgi:hypothetical protein